MKRRLGCGSSARAVKRELQTSSRLWGTSKPTLAWSILATFVEGSQRPGLALPNTMPSFMATKFSHLGLWISQILLWRTCFLPININTDMYVSYIWARQRRAQGYNSSKKLQFRRGLANLITSCKLVAIRNVVLSFLIIASNCWS